MTEPYETPAPLASVERLLAASLAFNMEIGGREEAEAHEAVRLLLAEARAVGDEHDALNMPPEVHSAHLSLLAFAQGLGQR